MKKTYESENNVSWPTKAVYQCLCILLSVKNIKYELSITLLSRMNIDIVTILLR